MVNVAVLASDSGLPVIPTDFEAAEGLGEIYTGVLVTCFFVALSWSIWCAARERSVMPLVLVVGGLISCLTETQWDILGHLWWPETLPQTGWEQFGRSVPLLVPAAYGFWSGTMTYVFYRMARKGVSFATWIKLIFGVEIAAVLFEMPWTANDVYIYYADSPFKIFGYPLWWASGNTTVPLLAALGLLVVLPRLRSPGAKIAVGLLFPTYAWGVVYGTVGLPMLLALNSTVPVPVKYGAALLMIITGILASTLLAKALAEGSPLRTSAKRAEEAAEAELAVR